MAMSDSSKVVGWWGERVAAAYLQRQGFLLLDHHYVKKWGEIDLVMSHANKVHFIEVKSTTDGAAAELAASVTAPFRPEQHVQPHKLDRIRRTAESWLDEFGVALDRQIDVVSVYLSSETKQAWVEVFWGVG